MDTNPDEETDMEALMGFTSFQELKKAPPNKRRKMHDEGQPTTPSSSITTIPPSTSQPEDNLQVPPSVNLAWKSAAGDWQQNGPYEPRQDGFQRGGRSGQGGRGGGNRGGHHHGNTKDKRPYYPSQETDGAHPVLSKKLEELDTRDLYLLRGGVRDDQGRIVFFTKGMVDDDPWRSLKGPEVKNDEDSTKDAGNNELANEEDDGD
jgi:hypothetical protein